MATVTLEGGYDFVSFSSIKSRQKRVVINDFFSSTVEVARGLLVFSYMSAPLEWAWHSRSANGRGEVWGRGGGRGEVGVGGLWGPHMGTPAGELPRWPCLGLA